MAVTGTTQQRLSDSLSAVIEKLRTRFAIIALLIVVPLSLAMLWMAVEERRETLNGQIEIAQSLAENLVEAQQDLLTHTRTLLMQIALSPAARAPSSPDCSAYLAALLPLEPRYVNFGVPRSDGTLLCNALPLSRAVNVADRPYIRRALEAQEFSVGTFQLDRAVQKVTVNFAYPVYDETQGAAPVGAAVAVVSLDWWSDALAAADLPEGSIAYIVDSDYILLAHFPPRPGLIGTEKREGGLDRPGDLPEGARARRDPDGARRVYDKRALFSAGGVDMVSMTIGIPIDAALSAANTRNLNRFALLVLGLLGSWVFASLQFRRLILQPLSVAQAELESIGTDPRADQNHPERPDGDASDMVRFTEGVREIWHRGQIAEDAERRTSRQMSALLSALPDLFFHLDREGRVIDFKSGNKGDLLKPPECFLGKRISSVIPETTGEEFEHRLQVAQDSQTISTWDYQMEVGGAEKVFEARICPVVDADEFLLVIRDISFRKREERKRQAAEGQLREVLRNIDGAAITYTIPAGQDAPGPDDTVRFLNKEGCFRIWGIDAEVAEADIMALWNQMPEGAERDEVIRSISAATRDLHPWHAILPFVTPQGQRIWVEERGLPKRQEDGSTQFFCLAVNVTEQVEKERELEHQKEVNNRVQKQQSLGQLTGGIAHDFNNLLAVIMGNLELLRDDLADPEQIDMVDAGINATKRGADLTRSMLAFAKEARLEPQPINLNTLVSETRKWAGRTLPETIEIETSLSAGLWTIEADPASTESALLNLILNARDAMPEGGKLTIETANIRIDEPYIDARDVELSPGRYTILAVSDTGHGIAAEKLSHIFEPFFTTKAPGAGSGLGLAMIQGFIEQSGGTAQVYSEPGHGTTFKLYFPATCRDAGEVASRQPTEPDVPHGDFNILLVEDEDDVRRVLASLLEKAGYRVTPAMRMTAKP
ncbi:Signal transduction histidine kinase [Poseidonocella sedimentorum]|uniref:histidine kinase n=1 Tax=Poseidonocella sedimentorum TaxID=871652 RepID=A0A1I6DXV6_9RHOB|nr:Signal transduction histidine kinase [Poseidonocella sedimentorum]